MLLWCAGVQICVARVDVVWKCSEEYRELVGCVTVEISIASVGVVCKCLDFCRECWSGV